LPSVGIQRSGGSDIGKQCNCDCGSGLVHDFPLNL
jgi:hypothetical protein